MAEIRGGAVILEPVVVRNVVGCGSGKPLRTPGTASCAIGFVMSRLNPPIKPPQEIPEALSRLPMFCPDMVRFVVFDEQTSPFGSASLITVDDPAPPATIAKLAAVVPVAPLVWPEIRFSAPGVDGPNPVL